MIALVVYADILIILNFLVDYFLLLATAGILNYKLKIYRLILASLFGGISSLYIFLPQGTPLQSIIVKLLICSVTTVICFKFESFKMYIKSILLFFVITSGYAGLMMAFWHIFEPEGLLINNSVVYLNISPIILVSVTVVTYLIFWILHKIFSKSNKACEECDIKVCITEKSVDLHALVDTGNSVEDIFGRSEIIIADASKLELLFGKDFKNNAELKPRFRVVPFSTISGEDILKGIRCDEAYIYKNNKTIRLEKPILAASKVPLNDEYNAIVNPRIFD